MPCLLNLCLPGLHLQAGRPCHRPSRQALLLPGVCRPSRPRRALRFHRRLQMRQGRPRLRGVRAGGAVRLHPRCCVLDRRAPGDVFDTELFGHGLAGLLHPFAAETSYPTHSSVATGPVPGLGVVHLSWRMMKDLGAPWSVFDDEKFCVVHKAFVPPCDLLVILARRKNSL